MKQKFTLTTKKKQSATNKKIKKAIKHQTKG